MEEEKSISEEVLTTDTETLTNPEQVTTQVQEPINSMSVPNQDLPVTQSPVSEPINPTPVVVPQVEEVQIPVVEPIPPVETLQTPVAEPTPPVETLQTPVAEPTPPVETLQTPVGEPTPPVVVTESIVETPEQSKKPEGKSSILKVILMIVLVLAIIAGVYYVYKEYFDKPVEEESPEVLKKEEENKDKSSEVVSWNGVYKLDTGTMQLLLFEEANQKVSLMIAKEVVKDGKKVQEYSHHYSEGLINKDGRLYYNVGDNPILEITKFESKVTITYVGEEEKKSDYVDILGVYSKLKDAKTYSADEFVE